MNLILLGYGKMGKAIEAAAYKRGHSIVLAVDQHNFADFEQLPEQAAHAAIEFTEPGSAVRNLDLCFAKKIPVVSGTTGWLDQLEEVKARCQQQNGGFFYASNFSIGVNLFFRLNQLLAEIMDKQPQYSVQMEETHHIQKKDAPSGTAITLAEGIIARLQRKSAWKLANEQPAETEVPVKVYREEDVPGTHKVEYRSSVDTLQISHTAHSREGFASGAVMAAEWLQGRSGVFGMADMLQL